MRERIRRLAAFLRRPHVLVFGGVLVVWLIAYWAYEPPFREKPPVDDDNYSPIMARGDGHYMYLATLSLVFDRDLDLSNQYREHGDPFSLNTSRMSTGERFLYPIGTSIVQIPFFLVGHALTWVGNTVFGAHTPLHGYTYVTQRVTFLGAMLAGWVALILGWRIARRHVSQTAALYGVLVVGLATGLFFYSAYWVSYQHAWSAFSVALLLEYWDRTRGRHDARRWLALGACVGLAALVRMNDVMFALIPAAEGGAEVVRRLRARDFRGLVRLAGYGVLATAAALVIVSPQLYANWRFFGGPFAIASNSPYFMRWESPFFWEVLFSSRNGLFVWTPLAYLCAVGLFLAPRGARITALALIVGFLVQVWVNGASWDWWASFSFSARRLVDCSAALVVGMAFVVERLRALHRRFPRLAPHAALVLLLLPFVVMNMELSHAVSKGAQKTGQTVAWSDMYTSSFRRLFKSVNDYVGNPFSWPHNLLWAARHRTSPARHETLVGGELLYVELKRYRTKGARHTDVIGIKGMATEGPWGPVVTEGKRAYAWARPGARALVPLMVYEDVSIVVLGAPPVAGHEVVVQVNGGWEERFTPTAGTQELRLVVPNGKLHPGTNEVTFRCEPPPAADTGCLAVERLTLSYESRWE